MVLSRLVLVALFIFFVEESMGYKVPDTQQFKDVIERTTGKSISHAEESLLRYRDSVEILDDKSFTGDIPCELSSKQEHVARPLSESIKTKCSFSPRRIQVPRKRLGIDDMPTEYWYDNRIHTFGNVGIFGGLHAACAPLATWLIDENAYDQVNARAEIAKTLHKTVNKKGARVLDLCCGVGMSTRALADVFTDAEFIGAVDTSIEMISMAQMIGKLNKAFKAVQDFFVTTNHTPNLLQVLREVQKTGDAKSVDDRINYVLGNAERVIAPRGEFDLVTIFFAFHEIPFTARYLILRETRRLLKPGGTLAVVDINTRDYTPSPTMLAGEPYVLEYQKNIESQMESIQGFTDKKKTDVVPRHVMLWTLRRDGKDDNDNKLSFA